MFVREKQIGSYSYLYLVETVRENGKTKQRIIRNLGRKEVVEAGGDLDRLARSAARLSQRSMILSLVVDGSMPNLTCRRIGAPLLFERLWQESGCRAVVEGLLAARRFEFAVERAVFLTVLHRLMVSGSDRACEHWRDDYHIDDIDGLDLHGLSRYETAFQILHKLRAGMVRPDQDRIGGRPGEHVKVDETWAGGRTADTPGVWLDTR